MLLSILEQSLLFFPLALGVYISYVVLRIPDLTTEGTFVLGASVFGISVHAGVPPLLATLFSIVSGFLIGAIVSSLQSYLRLHPLITGILMVFILNSLTLKLMGRPNLSLFDEPSLFSSTSNIIPLALLTVSLIVAAASLLASRLGLALYAFGNNPLLLNLCGKNSRLYRLFGLSLSNGLAGCAGALTAQVHGYADIGMGTGIVLIALATVILGQQLTKSFYAPFFRLVCCLVGVILYFCMVNVFVSLGLDPVYLRLMIGISLFVFLALTPDLSTHEVKI